MPDLSLAPPGKGMAFVLLSGGYALGVCGNEDMLCAAIEDRSSAMVARTMSIYTTAPVSERGVSVQRTEVVLPSSGLGPVLTGTGER